MRRGPAGRRDGTRPDPPPQLTKPHFLIHFEDDAATCFYFFPPDPASQRGRTQYAHCRGCGRTPGHRDTSYLHNSDAKMLFPDTSSTSFPERRQGVGRKRLASTALYFGRVLTEVERRVRVLYTYTFFVIVIRLRVNSEVSFLNYVTMMRDRESDYFAFDGTYFNAAYANYRKGYGERKTIENLKIDVM